MKFCCFFFLAVFALLTQCYGQYIDESRWLKRTEITFAKSAARLTDSAKRRLAYVEEAMAVNPGFKVVIEGSAAGGRSMRQLNRNRVDAVVAYLVRTVDTQRLWIEHEGNAPACRVVCRVLYNREMSPR